MANYLKPVAAILVPNIGGFASGYFTKSEVMPSKSGEVTWFQVLRMLCIVEKAWQFFI